MKNNNLTLLDTNQIQVLQHDSENDAQRVIIIGDTGKDIVKSIKDGLKDLKLDVNFSQEEPKGGFHLERIEIPTIVKEIEIIEIEKPIVITEIKVIEIERPVIVPEVRIIEIEKQILVKESEPMSTFIKYVLVIQTLAVVARVFFEIIHH